MRIGRVTLLSALIALAFALAGMYQPAAAHAGSFTVTACRDATNAGAFDFRSSGVGNGTPNLENGWNCPSYSPYAEIRGVNAGIWVTSCASSSPCYASTSNTAPNQYRMFWTWAPAGAFITNIVSHWATQTSARAAAPPPDRYQWWTEMWSERREGGQHLMTSDSCVYPIAGEYDCSNRRPAGQVWTQSEIAGAGGSAGAVAYGALCAPTSPYTSCSATYAPDWGQPYYCGNGWYSCQVRINMRTLEFSIVDETKPGLSVSDVSGLWSNNWISGRDGQPAVRRLSMVGTDNTGIQATALLVDGTAVAWNDYKYVHCWAVPTTWGQPSHYFHPQPCPTTFGQNMDYNISGLSTGTHTVRVQASDPSGEFNFVDHTLRIDHTRPGPGPGCAGPQVNDPAPVNGIAPDGRRWLRNSVVVTGTACDPTDGSGVIASSNIQYSVNGSSTWQDCGNSGSNTVPRCNLDIGSYAEGTTVRFRVRAQDAPGNIGYSPVSSTYYIDNQANQLSAGAFSMVGFSGASGKLQADANNCVTVNTATVDDMPSCITVAASQWTNKRTVRVKWTAASPGSGSPIKAYKYIYNNGCGPGSAGDVPGGATGRQIDVANQGQFTDENDCSQGAHAVSVWPVDWVDNENSAGALQTSYRYDSVAPASPTDVKVSPSNWSNQRTFQVTWTNPRNPKDASTAASKTSPLAQVRYRLSDDPVRSWSDCVGSLQECGAHTVTIPNDRAGGAYQVKFWLRDQAGNQDESASEVGVLYYNDEICIRG